MSSLLGKRAKEEKNSRIQYGIASLTVLAVY